MKITKEEFESLYSDDILKRKYDEIIGKVDSRFSEITNFIFNKKGGKGWVDYDTGDYETNDGYFEPKDYKEQISIIGEYIDGVEPFKENFPTRWLWEDFEEEFKKTVKEYAENEERKKLAFQEKKVKKKEKRKAIMEAVKSKLTQEELEYITFK